MHDNWNVEGEHGELHVFGSLTEGACSLDMTSARQDVNLGNMTAASLGMPGDQGTPVAVTLKLRDCFRTRGESTDHRTGGLVWDSLQPVVTASFVAPADMYNPQLVAVRGAQGFGLRITDRQGRDVRLGDRGAPQFVTPGQDELVYRIIPERTAAPVTPGAWQSVVNFRLNYD
ncbi:TPA: fimbrial protein [Klebsiella aerogenes]